MSRARAGARTPVSDEGDGAGAAAGDRRRNPQEWAFRRLLESRGGRFPPSTPAPIWQPWVNAALLSRADYERAIAELERCGLPPHPDPPKNWDALVALGLVLAETDASASVLDAGAAPYSTLLPWLSMLGYERLWGIDLAERATRRLGPIVYERGDVTRTRFPDDMFDAVTCLSVIEHGVDLDAYLAETARILRSGGLLVMSTDYWSEPVDTRGRSAYGAPLTIFGPRAIEALVERAGEHGFAPLVPLDLRTGERAVEWREHRLRYTFVTVALRAGGLR